MNPIRKILLVAAASVASALSAGAQAPFAQWDFDGGLNGTVGDPLTYIGDTEGATSFGTTTSFGLADIDGAEATVMKFPKTAAGQGYRMPVPDPNGSPSALEVNVWTVVMDVLIPADSFGNRIALIDNNDLDQLGLTDEGAEFWIGPNGGLVGILGQEEGIGMITADTWHRIVITSDYSQADRRITVAKYIDGTQVGKGTQENVDGASLTGSWALTTFDNVLLFSEAKGFADAPQTAVGYVSSIQLRDMALSQGQVFALGGAEAAGVPEDLPEVPSFIEAWMPSGQFTSPTSDVGAVINKGSTMITTGSIVLSIDGTPVASPSFSESGETVSVIAMGQTFPASTDHMIVVTYTDSKDGEKTFSKDFRVPVFYEDFEGLALGPNVDEASQGDEVWTHTPPSGWVQDDSGVPGIDSADDDGDGHPDFDGRTEWAGWSFANKDWWVTVDDQNRSQFKLASGTVMIADPDEWDDGPHVANIDPAEYPDIAIDRLVDNGGTSSYNVFITTPAIPLAGTAAGTAFMEFDSSWRPEDQQTATITVSFDGGDPIEVLRFESTAGDNFHPDAENEHQVIVLNNPDGAGEMVLEFALTDAGNDWWWAVDNIVVDAGTAPPFVVEQPADIDVEEGDPATFSVVAGGGEPYSYQWLFNGEPIDGATSDSYTIPGVSNADGGAYSVLITNSAGEVTSNSATLKVQLKVSGVTLFFEDFEGLTLEDSVDEMLSGAVVPAVWTDTPPDGWTVDDSGVPTVGNDANGVAEWEGWSFADPAFWNDVAGQSRDSFTRGTGTIAIADGDEWDDKGSGNGRMIAKMNTPDIDISGVQPGTLILKFDNSWNPEPTQTAKIWYALDGGDYQELAFWESVDGPNFKAQALNESVTLSVPSSVDSSTVSFLFEYEGGNNWWWAIDNVALTGKKILFAENFDGLTLGPNVQEPVENDGPTSTPGSVPEAFTHTPPTGWALDNSGVPTIGNDASGVEEWEGWSFADPGFWNDVAGQDRDSFALGTGIIAIADGDEWDDIDDGSNDRMNAKMTTPAIDISGVTQNLVLQFDNSWRPEPTQTAKIWTSFDGAEPTELVIWASEGANSKPDALNETVAITVPYPQGASTVAFTFDYDAGNNWWWAIDNIEVFENEEAQPPLIVLQPVKQIVSEGGDAVLSVGAEGQELSYQWYFNGQPVEGATEAELHVNLADPSNAGDYSVDVVNPGGTVTSETVSLEVFSGMVGDDLVVHLPFDGDATDASGSGNNGTPEGALAYVGGTVGQSLSANFNGENSVSLGAPADLNFGTDTDFSVSFWVKYTTTSSDPGFLGNKDWGSGGNQGYVFAVSGDGIKWNIADGNGNRSDSSGLGTLNDGVWHHYAATFDRDGFGTAYIDGVAAGDPVSIANIGNVDTPAGLATIVGDDGTGAYGAADGPRIEDGEMDELGIWRRVLTPDEVYYIYVAGAAGADLSLAAVGNTQEGPVAGQWDFDNGDLTATVGGDMTYADGDGGATSQATSFATMQIGGEDANVMAFAAAFGPMGYLAPAGGPNGGIGATKKNQYTLIFDIQWPAAADATWRSFAQIDAIDNSNDGEFFVNTSNGIGISGNYTGTIVADTWHRVVFAVDQRPGVNTIAKYIDGVPVGEQGAGGFDGRWALGELVNLLSDDTDGESQAGFVNSIQIRNEVLTPDQVASIGGASAAGIPMEIGSGSGPVLGITLDAGGVSINWDSPDAILQWTPMIGGTWMNVDGATSPYSPDTSGGEGYFRLIQ